MQFALRDTDLYVNMHLMHCAHAAQLQAEIIFNARLQCYIRLECV